MITIENVNVTGFEAAIRGMRNPMNSWDKSDSNFNAKYAPYNVWFGANDKRLMINLVKAGSDHRKFMRMINVTMDIKAPLYWWKNFDTYKVGTVANSCSTMLKIHEKAFTLDDFSYENLSKEKELMLLDKDPWSCKEILCLTIIAMNFYRKKFIETKDKTYWWQMIQLLPSSYNQLRTVQLNYEVLYSMYFARKDHKLDEWRTFCEHIKKFPLMESFINGKENPNVY